MRIIQSSPAEKPYTGSILQRAGLKGLSADLIAKYVTEVSLAENTDGDELLIVPEELRQEVEVLKQLTWFYVINSRSIKSQQYGQREVVSRLFKIYLEATGSSDADLIGMIPEEHREQLGEDPDERTRARVVADLISSMTERQLLITHRKLSGVELGSITDLI